jgi:hypothetical protein
VGLQGNQHGYCAFILCGNIALASIDHFGPESAKFQPVLFDEVDSDHHSMIADSRMAICTLAHTANRGLEAVLQEIFPRAQKTSSRVHAKTEVRSPANLRREVMDFAFDK